MKPPGVSQQRLVELIEECTQSVPGSIAQASNLREMQVWDSMSMVMFIALVAEKTGVTLSADDIRGAATPVELFQTIARGAR